MGLIKKLAVGTAITAGATTLAVGAAAGYGILKFGKYMRSLIYPPTFKKYIALAALPLAIYSIKHPEEIANGIKQTSYSIGSYISEKKEDSKSKRIDELEQKLKLESKEKSDAYSLLDQKNLDLQKIQNFAAFFARPNSPQSQISSQSSALQEASFNSNNSLSNGYLDISDKLLNQGGDKHKVIFIDRKKELLYLVNTEQSRVEAYYDITTGKNISPKKHEGDLATPVGIYNSIFEIQNSLAGFTSQRRKLEIPSEIGSGILIIGTEDKQLLHAISNKMPASNGGIILSASDYIDLEKRVESEKIMVEIK